jgi:hypothetical protein
MTYDPQSERNYAQGGQSNRFRAGCRHCHRLGNIAYLATTQTSEPLNRMNECPTNSKGVPLVQLRG